MFEQQIAPPADSRELLARATALAGLTLGELATRLQRPLPADLRRHKGLIGQYLELALGADGGARPQPDFAHLGIELKTIPIGGDGLPLETTYVCTAPLSGIAGECWQHSLLRRKLSRVLWLSALFLLLSGVCDGVSVVVRSTIMQLATPDEMRGRVSSVNSLFISSSNELGAFYMGSMARLLGLVNAVVLGGFATMGVAAITAWKAPRLRRLDLRDLH